MNTLELWLTKCILSIPYLRCCSKGRKVVLVWLGRKSSQRQFIVHLVVLPWLVLLLLRLLVLVLLLRVLELVLLLLQLDVGGPVPLVGSTSTLRSNTARQILGRVVIVLTGQLGTTLEREASLRVSNALTSKQEIYCGNDYLILMYKIVRCYHLLWQRQQL